MEEVEEPEGGIREVEDACRSRSDTTSRATDRTCKETAWSRVSEACGSMHAHAAVMLPLMLLMLVSVAFADSIAGAVMCECVSACVCECVGV